MSRLPRALGCAVLFSAIALAGCRPAPAPPVAATPTLPATAAPAAVPTAAIVTTPTAAATAGQTVAPTGTPAKGADQLPPGWQRETTDQLTIAIPPGWRVVSFTGDSAQAAYEALLASDPVLAGVVGGPEALEGAAFWAFAPAGSAQGAFVDNLNVRRTPLGAQPIVDIQEVIDVLLPEYEKMGLAVTSTDPALRVAGFPAARITYTLTASDPGAEVPELRGRQFIVATGEDLWVLSYTTTPEREARLAADFETSAQSFRPK